MKRLLAIILFMTPISLFAQSQKLGDSTYQKTKLLFDKKYKRMTAREDSTTLKILGIRNNEGTERPAKFEEVLKKNEERFKKNQK